MAEENAQQVEQEQATDKPATADDVSAQTVEIHRAVAGVVHADRDVIIRQGGAREIHAQEVTVRQGGAVQINAERVKMTQGAAVLVRGADVSLGAGSSSAAIIADTVKLDQAGAQFILARDNVEMDQGAAGILVGQRITAKDSTAVLMFANTVEGNVSVAMDRQTATVFGAALGAALGLVLGVFGIMRRRK
jgi:cytoskeletal protein CcmA (bactofilin family)